MTRFTTRTDIPLSANSYLARGRALRSRAAIDIFAGLGHMVRSIFERPEEDEVAPPDTGAQRQACP